MKRTIYLILFTFFGILLGILVVGLIELAVIFAFRHDPQKYGLDWTNWYAIHIAFTAVLASAGAVWGFISGKKCWFLLYEGPNPLCKVPFYKRARAFRGKPHSK